MRLHPALDRVTSRIIARSRAERGHYLMRLQVARAQGPARARLSCANFAHGLAACEEHDKQTLKAERGPNIAIVSAYNDVLSAHQPLGEMPGLIKRTVREAGGVAQFAGGVPAMCDGVTQGEPGMELSLFSRDVIAMSTAVALSHNLFDGVLCLGVCDKIVPGLLIGALSFGHLPAIFVPGGPMISGLDHGEKAKVRQLYAEGKADRGALLVAEANTYHGPGTCTFYGTANSNQMLMELMGLHIPGAAFFPPHTAMRTALTQAAARRITQITALSSEEFTPIGEVIDERSIVNGVVGLLATGGSTNHAIHLPAIARAAGITIDWDDFSDLSRAVPVIARVYPNGRADVNQFHSAGGIAFVVGQLLERGLLHRDVRTVAGSRGLEAYAEEPQLDSGSIVWSTGARQSRDMDILRPVSEPFCDTGGLQLLTGNLGRAVIKVSAVERERRVVVAPAAVFDSQDAVVGAFQRRELDRDFVALVRFQGPRANGMPELHKLTPILGLLQNRGYRVALVTDGRMSGASGQVPAAIHVSPECAQGGPLARVENGDLIRLDAEHGVLEAEVDEATWKKRLPATVDVSASSLGMGRELFTGLRALVGSAETGATTFGVR